MSSGAGISGAIKPGILCTIAALASGFAMDIFVCQPADEVYCRTVSHRAFSQKLLP